MVYSSKSMKDLHVNFDGGFDTVLLGKSYESLDELDMNLFYNTFPLYFIIQGSFINVSKLTLTNITIKLA